MKTLKIILVFSVIAAFSPHKGNSQSQFQFFFGGSADDEANCIINTRDSGYILTGHTRNFGAGNSDVYIVKLSVFGLVEWNVTAGGFNNDIGRSIVQTYEGGFIVGAESRSFLSAATDIYLIRLDSSGSVLWEKIITGFAAGDHSIDFLYTVIQTPDSGFMVSATTGNVQAGISGIQLFKLNSDGAIQWNRVYSTFGRYMIGTSDGGYALAGSSNNRMYILKLDSNGNFQWNTAVGGNPQDVARSIVQTTDGGYVIAGETMSYGSASGNMYIAKFDSLGTLQWTRYVGRSSGRSAATEIVQTTDGGYAVGGHSNSFGNQGRYNVYLVKLDLNGAFEWNRSVGTNSDNEFGNTIKQTPDGGYIIGGYRSTGFGTNMYIIKFDSDGNTCIDMTTPVSANGTGGVVTTPSPILFFPGYIVETPASLISSGGTVTPYCGLVNVMNPQTEIPSEFKLWQNYPNPFNPSTIISYSLPVNSNVTLKVFDIIGKEVATLVNEFKNIGYHTVEFVGLELPSGIYFYTLTAGEFKQTKRMLLVK